MNAFPLITVLTLTPLVGGLAIICLGEQRQQLARRLGVAFSLVALGLAVALWHCFDPSDSRFQMGEQHNWVTSPAIQYYVAVDGLGLLMVMLSAIVVPMALIASWRIERRVPVYFALVLFLEAGLFGTFTALNFFHWFIFWELSLIPAFFLIKLWGGPSRSHAATQFFVYTMAGSVAMLLAFLAMYLATGTFDFTSLAERGRDGTLSHALAESLGWRDLTEHRLSLVIFAGVFLGLAVKVPLMPFHTWLPSAYAEAPTGTTMLLTGVMSKMGVYGFVRILLPIMPGEMRAVMTPLLWLAVITIVFSAGAAFAQRDLKRIFAYSSINHLGYCLLGVFAVLSSSTMAATPAAEKAAALNGVFLQMFNHGITAATLFWFVGYLETRGGGLRGLDDFGGLRKITPVLCGLMGIAMFASLGLPGLNGFIGEFLIFKGAFPLVTWAAALAVLGPLITAVFLLTVLQRVFNGPLNQRWAAMPDLTRTERVVIAPALALMLIIGVYPRLVLDVVNGTVMQMVGHLRF